jgi:hypothetical protein
MKTYTVELCKTLCVGGIEAESEEEAKQKALALEDMGQEWDRAEALVAGTYCEETE